MNIQQIANRLNEKAIKDGFKIGSLPELRKTYLHKKQLPRKIFTWQTIIDGDDKYAFHNGGRDEIQFNVGEEYIKEKAVTRFGLCFSLEPSPSLTNPVDDLDPFRKRFNDCVSIHPELFTGFEMWYYQDNERHGNFKVQQIPDEWFKYKSFICLGNLINKPLSSINETDIEDILIGFDKLFPIYQICVLDKQVNTSIEKRIARLAYNDNGWVMPSGPYGKSVNVDSHEANFGYGHEEWIFDISKIIDGYHYGFLEPIRKQQQAYIGNKYFVWLYTIDGKSKKRYWVGVINNLEVISIEDANKIKDIYVKHGWFDEMNNQIISSGANKKGFSAWEGVDLFNIRYKPQDLNVNEPYYELPASHAIYKQARYAFAHLKEEFLITEHQETSFEFVSDKESTINEGQTKAKVESKVFLRSPKSIENEYLHKAISDSLTSFLKIQFGNKNVKAENRSGIGANRIDIVVKTNNTFIFYEIKTYNSVMASIREAIGQLLEYSMWPNRNNAKQLIVVTQKQSDIEDVKIYFKHLRSQLGISIYYQWFDIETNILSEKF